MKRIQFVLGSIITDFQGHMADIVTAAGLKESKEYPYLKKVVEILNAASLELEDIFDSYEDDGEDED